MPGILVEKNLNRTLVVSLAFPDMIRVYMLLARAASGQRWNKRQTKVGATNKQLCIDLPSSAHSHFFLRK
jgi:hypothetical protein